ncbi:hypothetical protein SAMN05421874_12086 [Nonomuraea maritima]|uniref:Uncharacterized protein n=1 Tax=Nonomuraea maritima TaxID=683260 RepID=A0A1G9JK99_9ACTN|nr:hypothetical protein [Nonomuraea maritima]SDL37514.1 hypothetical protein SAMN05421874_12086 [Nonomuraea maritima]
MRNIRKLFAGTVLAGALAAGAFAAPASAATATTANAPVAASAQAFSGWKYLYVGGHDGRIGYQWGRNNGRYYLNFKLWDRDRHDRGFTWFDVYYKRDGRWHHYKRFSTKNFYEKDLVFGRDVDDIRIRYGYGWDNHFNWGSYRYYR